MNKKYLTILLILTLAIVACSVESITPARVVGSGKVASRTRDVSGFNAVSLQGSGNVDVTIASTDSVVVQADDNILPLVETTVQGGKLVISTRSNSSITTVNPINVKVTMKTLTGLALNGSGNMTATGVTAKDLAVSLSGSGNINVTGTADSVKLDLPGSGNILCNGLQARSAQVTVNGSGMITVYASENLDASILGSGTISYSGNPSKVSKRITGSGSITP